MRTHKDYPLTSELRNNEAVESYDVNDDLVTVYLGTGFWFQGRTSFTVRRKFVEDILLYGVQYVDQ